MMKIRFLPMIISTATIALSSAAFAGEGAGCDSKKGGHKDMSVEALKEFNKNHAWSDSQHGQSKSAESASDQPKIIETTQSTPKSVEI